MTRNEKETYRSNQTDLTKPPETQRVEAEGNCRTDLGGRRSKYRRLFGTVEDSLRRVGSEIRSSRLGPVDVVHISESVSTSKLRVLRLYNNRSENDNRTGELSTLLTHNTPPFTE